MLLSRYSFSLVVYVGGSGGGFRGVWIRVTKVYDYIYEGCACRQFPENTLHNNVMVLLLNLQRVDHEHQAGGGGLIALSLCGSVCINIILFFLYTVDGSIIIANAPR